MNRDLQIEHMVRQAKDPDNHRLINQFLEQKLAVEQPTKANLRNHHLAQFQVLMETLADECLPAHWRCSCLDNIYRPLQALERLADCPQHYQQVLTLTHELRIISHYLLPGLITQERLSENQHRTLAIGQVKQ